MTEGRKDDAQKPRWTLLPWRAMARVLAVLEHGAQHYGPDNWRRVENLRDRYINAALRHIVAVLRGEWLDSDSGEPHLAHAIASLAFVLEDAEIGGDAPEREEAAHPAPTVADRAEAAAQHATRDCLAGLAAREAAAEPRRTESGRSDSAQWQPSSPAPGDHF